MKRIHATSACRLALLSAAWLLLPAPSWATGEIRGRFVLDARGQPVAPESFRRGLQPSGLLYRDGALWSLGDQRSQYPNHIFIVDPATARLRGRPIGFSPPEAGALAGSPAQRKQIDSYLKIPNSDFEALTSHPTRKDVVLAVTEDKIPWLAQLRVEAENRLRILRLTELRFPEGLTPWRKSPNFRIEGLTLSSDGETLYFAYERAADNLPRLLKAPTRSTLESSVANLEDVDISFASVARRADKRRALLNLNDIQLLRREGRDEILALARDQERVLLIDLAKRSVTKVVDLDFRAPDGRRIHWVSPEGLAFDLATDRLWIINDPDSVRGNYKLRDEEAASGFFAQYAPLLFELPLKSVLETR